MKTSSTSVLSTPACLEILRDCGDQRSIVFGRTGAGKTALLKMLAEQEERAISLDVRHLAIEYISHSTLLSSFEAAGVKLDLLYPFLWLHLPIPIPATYNPTAGKDWWQVEFFAENPSDTVTVNITLSGSPHSSGQ